MFTSPNEMLPCHKLLAGIYYNFGQQRIKWLDHF
jgi:hypothetical protein